MHHTNKQCLEDIHLITKAEETRLFVGPSGQNLPRAVYSVTPALMNWGCVRSGELVEALSVYSLPVKGSHEKRTLHRGTSRVP
jgi:hypothetical protein